MKLIDGYKYNGNMGRLVELLKFRNVTLIQFSVEKSTFPDYCVLIQIGGGSLLSFIKSIWYYSFELTILGKTYVY